MDVEGAALEVDTSADSFSIELAATEVDALLDEVGAGVDQLADAFAAGVVGEVGVATTAEVGVATADLFPRVSLSGFLGFTAGRGSQLGSSAIRGAHSSG